MGYPQQKVNQVFEALKNGATQKEVVKKYGVSPQTIRNWQAKISPRENLSEISPDSLQKANARIQHLESLMLRLIDRLDKAGLL